MLTRARIAKVCNFRRTTRYNPNTQSSVAWFCVFISGERASFCRLTLLMPEAMAMYRLPGDLQTLLQHLRHDRREIGQHAIRAGAFE